MKHKHSEMIKAKADDMRLTLLSKGDKNWKVSVQDFPIFDGLDYFLCHTKHADTCLHCLNGGKAQLYSGDRFHDMPMYSGSEWSPDCVFMDADREIRIKPKKEKRWIVVDTIHVWKSNFCSNAYVSRLYAEERAKSIISGKVQIIEIEIEVE